MGAMIESCPNLSRALTAEEWVEKLAERGIKISARWLRERAVELGTFRKMGRTVLITPENLDLISESSNRCRSKSTSEKKNGGPEVRSNMAVPRSQATTAKALEHLKRQAHGNGVVRKKSEF